MSKFKTPREKKIASLLHDRRNIYGENDKASRKGAPRSKQLSHQAARRAARRPLHNVTSEFQEDDLAQVQADVLASEIIGKRKAFRKRRDVPLGNILDHKKTGDWKDLTKGTHWRPF
jgi:hypothetical protein